MKKLLAVIVLALLVYISPARGIVLNTISFVRDRVDMRQGVAQVAKFTNVVKDTTKDEVKTEDNKDKQTTKEVVETVKENKEPKSKYDSEVEKIHSISTNKVILDNIKARKTEFDVEYTESGLNVNNTASKVQEEIKKFRLSDSYDMHNLKSTNMNLSQRGDGPVTVHFKCEYRTTQDMENKLEKDLKSLLEKIAPDSMNQMEKELAIHDWIVNNSSYDETYKSASAYSMFYNHTGTCEGYSQLAQKMFTLAGIKSIIVDGKGDNEDHCWNMVCIDNKWYQVDVTWDDPITNTGEDVIRHNWYNISDDKMSERHSWDKSIYPSAN